MSIDWQQAFYPLGFISSVAFFSRFFFQWLFSERSGKSIVTKNFWYTSLIGNISLFIHCLIQQQFHVCLVQSWNVVIAWRNLNLLKEKAKHCRTNTVICLLMVVSLITAALFAGLGIRENNFSWFRVPIFLGQSSSFDISLYVHLLGFLGVFLMSLRFLIQWWHAEKKQESSLGETFWNISLAGNIISFLYFFYIFDPVNFVGPIFGIALSLRNVILLKKTKLMALKFNE